MTIEATDTDAARVRQLVEQLITDHDPNGDRNEFMGAQFDATFSTILLDSGPAAARVLLDDGVDVVLLTPI